MGPWDYIEVLGFLSSGLRRTAARRGLREMYVLERFCGAMWSRGREVAVREEEDRTGGELDSCLLPTQQKLAELQAGKKSLEDQVEMLRIVKEEAEKLEKEAKDQHQKLWEGMSLGGHDSLARGYWPGRAWAQKTCPSHICFLCWLNHAASVPHA